jgi:hypothetical protein
MYVDDATFSIPNDTQYVAACQLAGTRLSGVVTGRLAGPATTTRDLDSHTGKKEGNSHAGLSKRETRTRSGWT